MDTEVDLLKIKIDRAREALPEESRRAIDAVNWRVAILGMRAEKGYSYEQLENLEIETELLLCGLINPEDYPKELEKRMNIPGAQVDVLVNEMNEKVFKKIREELVKNMERRKMSEEVGSREKQAEQPSKTPIKNMPGETLAQNIENISLTDKELSAQKELSTGKPKIQPIKISPDVTPEKEESSILTQKFSGSFQIPTAETDHSLMNMTKNTPGEKEKLPKIDPYRETPQ